MSNGATYEKQILNSNATNIYSNPSIVIEIDLDISVLEKTPSFKILDFSFTS